MAWNEPGGKNGKKDPWSGGDQQPPDLDEVFRNLKGKIRGIFGGGGTSGSRSSGGGGGAGIGIILALIAIVWLGFSSIYIIDEPEQGVVLRFGKYVKTMDPGLNITFPPPIDEVYRVDVEQVRSVSTDGAMLSRDENIVIVDMAVQYRVKDANDFLFQVNEPEETLEQAAESAMRQVIGDNNMDEVLLSGRAEIAAEIRTILQTILDSYRTGLELTAVNLQDVRPPPQVKDAFDDAITAREDKERVQNEASAYANTIIPEARGEAARILEDAEAYRQSVIAQAEGAAARFTLLLREYQAAPEVTRQRLYLETVEEVLARTPKVLMDAADGNNVMYLPLEGMMSTLPPPSSDSGAGRTYIRQQPTTTVRDSDSLSDRSTNRRGREGRQ